MSSPGTKPRTTLASLDKDCGRRGAPRNRRPAPRANGLGFGPDVLAQIDALRGTKATRKRGLFALLAPGTRRTDTKAPPLTTARAYDVGAPVRVNGAHGSAFAVSFAKGDGAWMSTAPMMTAMPRWHSRLKSLKRRPPFLRLSSQRQRQRRFNRPSNRHFQYRRQVPGGNSCRHGVEPGRRRRRDAGSRRPTGRGRTGPRTPISSSARSRAFCRARPHGRPRRLQFHRPARRHRQRPLNRHGRTTFSRRWAATCRTRRRSICRQWSSVSASIRSSRRSRTKN